MLESILVDFGLQFGGFWIPMPTTTEAAAVAAAAAAAAAASVCRGTVCLSLNRSVLDVF